MRYLLRESLSQCSPTKAANFETKSDDLATGKGEKKNPAASTSKKFT